MCLAALILNTCFKCNVYLFSGKRAKIVAAVEFIKEHVSFSHHHFLHQSTFIIIVLRYYSKNLKETKKVPGWRTRDLAPITFILVVQS